MQKLLIISGPTGVGKTNISLQLAKMFNGEIISCDSMQIYKGFDIGTAKITNEEMCGIKHYMINVASPTNEYSVYDYKKSAEQIISKLNNEHKLPIMVGGTGLYINSVLYDYDFKGANKDVKLREFMQSMANKYGNMFLCVELKRRNIDFSNISFNDTKRLIRLLETDATNLDIKGNKQSKYDFLHISLNMDRAKLYDRINKRVDLMFENGLCDEVKNLLDAGIPIDSQPMQSIGYKEFKDYFNGIKTLEEVKDLIKLNSRHYAKRQLTWFRNSDNIVIYDIKNGFDDLFKLIGDWLTNDKRN